MARRYYKRLKPLARHLRTNTTEAEKRLWWHLRRKQLAGVQFYRQRPLGKWIVDFYAPRANLVVEVDGSQHFNAETRARDALRTSRLRSMGLKVLRFDNREVLTGTEIVLEEIYREVMQRIPPVPLRGTDPL